MDIKNILNLSLKFDLVFSSLAFHYVSDFVQLVETVYNMLNSNGVLLFSQEHPITTAPQIGPTWTKDNVGNKIYYNLADYMISGERHVKWFVDKVEKYHRPISEIINIIISCGFKIDRVVEPIPDQEALEKRPDLIDEFHKTTCIIIKATKI